MQLSEAVRRARAELGLSQKKLSEMAGIQRRQLATLEGGGNVTLSTLTKVLSQLPNLESFTIQGVTAKVQRNETADAVLRRYHGAFSSLVDIVRDLAEAHNAGRTIGPEKLRQLDEAHYVMQGQLGITPEETDEILQLPDDEADAVITTILQRAEAGDSEAQKQFHDEAEEE
ncbi:MAG TPA: helix-turn-helix domain-containing protein [Thermoanaerobaculia bacterium]|nr:helix-turn-helix domain-containing protein [Thermoanaerobaculia bacterium]